MKDLVGRLKAERLAGPPIEQALHLRHRRRMDCSEGRAFGEEVSDQTIRVLVHPAFPRMIGRGKEDVGVQALRGCSVSGELFAVVVGNGVDMVAQRFQTMHRGAVRGLGRWPGQFRDGREQAFALDMRQQPALMAGPHDGVALPVAQPRLGSHDRRPFRDVDPMRNHAAARRVSPTPVVALAPSPQESPQIAARALVHPDHLVDPFVTEREAAFGP